MAAFDEKEYNQAFDWSIWRRLTPILARFKGRYLKMVVFTGLTDLLDAALPLFQLYAVAHFIQAGTLEGLVPFVGVYLAAILMESVLVIAATRQTMHIEMYLGRDLRRDLFTHLQTLSLSFYNVTPVGYLLTRITNDTNRIAGNLAWGLNDMVDETIYVVSSFAIMFALDWQLALVVMLVAPFVAALTVYFQPRILDWNRKVRKINSKITGAFNEGITGAKTAKTLVIEDQSIKNFKDLTGSMNRSAVRAARLNAVYIPVTLFFSTLTVAIVLLRGGWLVKEQVLGIATLSAFISYAMNIFEPLQRMTNNLAEFIAVQASIERVTGLLDEKPQVTDRPEVVEKYGDCFDPRRENWEPLVGEIEFRDVTFRYPDGGDNVLEHFNLKIPAGATVAIVGETGAGKSTLVNLACRFFEPTEGQILIDGRDYRERSQLWLHSNIGYVLQSPHLFSGSIRENIRYGRLDAADPEIEAAAKAVSADQVVAKLDQGWDSDVGEEGDRLSTGEKQLISFARAVLADPRIFVLDEATSSIDTQTEQYIQSAIDHLLRDRTSFLIAHRLSTIRKADMILVVRDGKIVEQGTHQSLLKARGYYHDLYSKQFAEENAAKVLGA